MHLLVLSAFRPSVIRLDTMLITVSMHLLVLSAFRLIQTFAIRFVKYWSQCTFWFSVLSDLIVGLAECRKISLSQCTFWCSVLSDGEDELTPEQAKQLVSMHLLVLSAFRP